MVILKANICPYTLTCNTINSSIEEFIFKLQIVLELETYVELFIFEKICLFSYRISIGLYKINRIINQI